MPFAITTIGVDKARTVLRQKKNKLGKRSVVNKQAVVQLDAWIQRNFRDEGDKAYPGTGWKKLSPVTIAQRRKGPGAGSDKILQDTGQLKSRWKHYFDNNTALIQSGVDYGSYHQRGVPGKLPQRRILPTREQILPILKVLYGKFVKTSIG